MLESAYEECLCRELSLRAVGFNRQVNLPVTYRGVRLEVGYRVDLIVEDEVLVELKAVDQLLPVHEAQLLTYMKLSNVRTGLLINFHVPVLKRGLKRMKL